MKQQRKRQIFWSCYYLSHNNAFIYFICVPNNGIAFFKTSILVEDDVKKPQFILSQNKNCNLIICSILLAPRFAHYLIGKQMNFILFVTLYFSEFFVKYEQIIKEDKTIFNEEELKKIVKQMLERRKML